MENDRTENDGTENDGMGNGRFATTVVSFPIKNLIGYLQVRKNLKGKKFKLQIKQNSNLQGERSV